MIKLNRFYALLFCTLVNLVYVAVASAGDVAANPDLPKGKQTSLGLYLTAGEAYDKWQADPDIKILDVRTLEEYLFVGHAPMAWNIPLMVQTHEWDAEKGRFMMQANPDFLAEVKEVAGPADTIMVMCRSGGRSAKAVNQLAGAGYTNVYSITDGMEGDAIDDPLSVFNGQRLRNGWKNSGLPWTYEPDPERIMATGARPVAADKE
ncbi:MAG: rhodanese-like domain-containing protein [Lysobacterales bacterium]